MYVREVDDLFTVGQLLPKIEVPAPNSKKANTYLRNRLTQYIHRQFRTARRESDDPCIRVETIRKAFSDFSEANVRKRLKEVAEFRRGGNDSGAWYRKSGDREKTDAEIAAMVTPEEVCTLERSSDADHWTRCVPTRAWRHSYCA